MTRDDSANSFVYVTQMSSGIASNSFKKLFYNFK